jgi:dCTP diphosphatase
MSELEKLTEKILAFIEERDWQKWQKPKDLAIALSLEAGEVLEHFLWKDEAEAKKYIINNKEKISDELADVFIYLLELAHNTDINIIEAAEKKMIKNALNYPIEKAKGNNKKYTEF